MKLKRFISLGMLALAALLLLTSCPNAQIETPKQDMFQEYSGNSKIATPVANLSTANTYSTPQELTLTCSTAGAVIYYNLDSTRPNKDSAIYSSPIKIEKTTTITFMAVKAGSNPSNSTTEIFTFELSLASPSFSVSAGEYDSSQTVELSCNFIDAKIYYTLDETIPTIDSTLYTSTLTIDTTKTISAIAVYKDIITNPSSAKYTIKTSPVIFSITDPNLTTDKNLTLSCTTPDAEIYYTVNGDTPSASSTKYTNAILINSSKTISAIALKAGIENSNITSISYIAKCVNPVFSISESTITEEKTLTLSCDTPSTEIYYTTNGNTPTNLSNKYVGPITLDTNQTLNLKAIAIRSSWTSSDVVEKTYTVSITTKPVGFSVTDPNLNTDKNLELTCATSSATIYYTENGTTPDANSTKYTGPILLDMTKTISAVAIKTGITNSSVTSVSYIAKCVDPVFSIANTTVNGVGSLTFTSITNNADIYYTINGEAPTNASTKYTNIISLDTNGTYKIQAITIRNNWTSSNVITKTYTVQNGTVTLAYDASQLLDSDFKFNVTPTATTINFFANFDPLLMTIDQIVSPQYSKDFYFNSIKGVHYLIQWADKYDKDASMDPAPSLDITVSARCPSNGNYFTNMDAGWNSPVTIAARETEQVTIKVTPYTYGTQGIFYLSIIIYPTMQWYLDGVPISSATSLSYQLTLANVNTGLHKITCVANAGSKTFSRSYQFYKN